MWRVFVRRFSGYYFLKNSKKQRTMRSCPLLFWAFQKWNFKKSDRLSRLLKLKKIKIKINRRSASLLIKKSSLKKFKKQRIPSLFSDNVYWFLKRVKLKRDGSDCVAFSLILTKKWRNLSLLAIGFLLFFSSIYLTYYNNYF